MGVAHLLVHVGDGWRDAGVDVASFAGPTCIALASSIVAFSISGAFVRAKHVLQRNARRLLAVSVSVPDEELDASVLQRLERVSELFLAVFNARDLLWTAKNRVVGGAIFEDFRVHFSEINAALAFHHLAFFDHLAAVEGGSAGFLGFNSVVLGGDFKVALLDVKDENATLLLFFSVLLQEVGNIFDVLSADQRLDKRRLVRAVLLWRREHVISLLLFLKNVLPDVARWAVARVDAVLARPAGWVRPRAHHLTLLQRFVRVDLVPVGVVFSVPIEVAAHAACGARVDGFSINVQTPPSNLGSNPCSRLEVDSVRIARNINAWLVVDILGVEVGLDPDATATVVDHYTVVAFTSGDGAGHRRVASHLRLHYKVTLGGFVVRHAGRVPTVAVVVVPVLAVKRSVVRIAGGTALGRAGWFRLDVEVQRVVATVEFRVRAGDLGHQVNLPGLDARVDVVVDRLDLDGLGLVPVVGGPSESARVDSDPFWVRVGNVDDDDTLSLVSNA